MTIIPGLVVKLVHSRRTRNKLHSQHHGAPRQSQAVSGRPHRKRFPFAPTRDEREALRFDGDASFLDVLFGIPAEEVRGLGINCGKRMRRRRGLVSECVEHEGVFTVNSDYHHKEHGHNHSHIDNVKLSKMVQQHHI